MTIKTDKATAPFGLWESKITPKMLAAKSNRLGQMQTISGKLYWLESRAQDKGRGVIVEYSNGETKDITPEEYNVRTRVHEYGSGDFWGKGDTLIFANDKDQRLYCQKLSSVDITAITPESETKYGLRYADGDLSNDQQFSVCVREYHPTGSTAHQVVNELISINLISNQISIIATGADFYSNPRLSPDNKQLCWLQWNHPNMPWDETELWLADIDEQGLLSKQRKVAGGQQTSIYNPQWSHDNQLVFASDQNSWWHLYKNQQPLHQNQEIEFGFPQWQFACNSFQIIEDVIFAIGTKDGKQNLYRIDVSTGKIQQLEDEFCYFNGEFQCIDNKLYFMAATASQSLNVYEFDTKSHQRKAIKASLSTLSNADISEAQHMSFQTSEGDRAYGFYYPPKNSEYASENELPPLIVMSHGGPTGMTDAGFNLQVQFWTSRGFAVADVNYRGSTGYGRKYRDALKGHWGVYDVDDCIAMAEHLAKQGLVDGQRLAIRGGSAGGYTTLCALTFHDKFKVGMSRYGVADLLSLAQDSHKFEIRYLDSVVGPLPQAKQTYLDRSPCEHTDKLSCPILLLQGADDKVVPPSQSEAMVNALKAKGLAYEYIEFEGEGHGFRKPETIIKAFEAELVFYRKYLL
ncbi:MAG: S9 family peptidase [Gammaproteobacteria bacterium]|nr:S9 family peptidase [Gammaproteobacteria bacterium]